MWMLMYLCYRDYIHFTASYKTLLRLKCIHDGCHLSFRKQWDEVDNSRCYCVSEGWFLHKAEV